MATKTNGLPLEAQVAQCISAFKAPKTTQDAVDKSAAEFATAYLLRSHAEKRYEAAKRSIMDEHLKLVDDVRSLASESMFKSSNTIEGVEWNIVVTANRPALRTDVDELRTELVRMGVSVDTIDAAINKVTKKSNPALIINAALVNK